MESSWVDSVPVKVLIAIVGAFVSFVTITGNVLAIVAFFRNPRLKTTANLYIVSLAVADMLVGCVSIPFYVFYYLSGEWILGKFVCNCWLMLDYSLCYASMLSIFIICVDRFWSVSKPCHYLENATFDLAFRMLTPVWVYPLALFLFMVWLWPLMLPNHTTSRERVCEVPYTEVVVANVLISVISFWIPILIIFVLYCFIYRKCSELRRRNREKKIHLTIFLRDNMNLSYGLENMSPDERKEVKRQRMLGNAGAEVGKDQLKRKTPEMIRTKGDLRRTNFGDKAITKIGDETLKPNQKESPRTPKASTDPPPSSKSTLERLVPDMARRLGKRSFSHSRSSMNGMQNSASPIVSERRINKTLKMVTAIMGCYIACWAPFSVIVIVRSIDGSVVPFWLWNVCYCLCYLNSTFNPFCYAYANKHFKKTVVMLINKYVSNLNPFKSSNGN